LAAAGVSFAHAACGSGGRSPSEPGPPEQSPTPSPAARPVVAITHAPDYSSAYASLRYAFNLIGGIGALVTGRTVAVKVNVLGSGEPFEGLTADRTYVVNGELVMAATALLLENGARRVRILESPLQPTALDELVTAAGWDVPELLRLGNVELVSTRDEGNSQYVSLRVPGARLFERFDVHRAYTECDVFISLAKLKNHRIAGVSLTLKNLFGMPPNALYGIGPAADRSGGYRALLHDRRDAPDPLLPGELPVLTDQGPLVRVPRIITDLVSARPIDLAIIDGVTTVAGGEGPCDDPVCRLLPVGPGLVLVGRDAVATDAVSTAVMGYADPLSITLPPFTACENHLKLAHDAGLGVGDLSRIEVRGMTIAEARMSFDLL
jgi:uncharacterized protein (DUF362 family)